MDIELILQIKKVKSESNLTNTQINFYVDSFEEGRWKHRVVHTIYEFYFFNDEKKEELHKFNSIASAIYAVFGLNYCEIIRGLINEYHEKGTNVESKYSFSISAH